MEKTVIKDLRRIDPQQSVATNVGIIRKNIAQILDYINVTRSTTFCLAGNTKANDLKCISLLHNYKAWLAYKQASADDLRQEISSALNSLRAG